MEKRAIIAVVLSMAVFILWSFLFSPPPKAPPAETEQKATESTAKEQVAEKSTTNDVQKLPDTEKKAFAANGENQVSVQAASSTTVSTPLYTAVFSESGGRLKSFTLKKYRETVQPDSPPKQIVIVKDPEDSPLGLYFDSKRGADFTDSLFKADKKDISMESNSGKEVLKMTYRGQDGLEIEKVYTFQADSYLVDLDITLRNFSDNTIDDKLVMSMDSDPITTKDRYAGFSAYVDDKLVQKKPNKLKGEIEDLEGKNYKLSWAAYGDQYFMAAILPGDQERTRITADAYDGKGVRINFVNPPLLMGPQTEKQYNYTLFYGPKDFNLLKSMDNTLVKSIDFGFFDLLSKPLLYFMTWLHKFVGNYGVVIILVTIIIKALFWPLTAKSYKSMKNMQKLQPKIMKLREKFKDDREGMNREMMGLYKAYKVNPLGGCLPMVIQIPVFIALYRLLDYSLELRHEPFALWINDLAAPDRLFHFNFTLPLMEPPSGIPILTLLMGASMLLQQKMTPTPGDPTQAKIMMLMPIFFTFIFINFPSGLVLYWLTNNLLSIGQQTMINKRPS